MRRFGFLHGIPRDLNVFAPPTIFDIDVVAMFDDFYNHLVLEETRSVPSPSPKSGAYG